MLDSKLVFLHVLRRRIADLFISLNLDDENMVALLLADVLKSLLFQRACTVFLEGLPEDVQSLVVSVLYS
jgi:hypothetical protein